MQQTTPNESFADYLTVAEAAEFLGVSPWTLRNWDKAGKLRPVRHPVNGYRIYRQDDLQAVLQTEKLLGRRKGTLAPHFDWNEIGESEHFVQFYETESYLIESVSAFVGKALQAGDGAVIIATQPHRNRIQRKLRARGIDVLAARSRGQYVALDAAETLASFMVDGSPDPDRFREVVGGVIERLTNAWPRTRAFGEMVALLWKAGHRDEARRLEELWNDLGKTYSFALYCAYPLSEFGHEADGQSFHEICTCHTRVIPAESYARLATAQEQLRSITVLQQKAQALEAEIAQRRQAERELSDFVENALEGLHKVGPDGKILWANKAELDLLGYAPDEYIGHHIAEFHVDGDVIDDILCRLKRGENLFNCPARLRCKDGAIKHVLIHSNAHFEDGQFVYTRCFTRDVTADTEAERDRSLLASIIDCSDDAIVSKTLEGIIRSWNAGAERVFGYSAQEAIGQPVTIIIPPDRLEEERVILERLKRGQRIDHFETERLAKDGRRLDISLTVSPVRDATGKIVGASKIARDITDRKQADKALRESEQRFVRFMERLPGLAWIKDLQGRYVFVNEAVQKPFGAARGEVCGKTDDELFQPETAAQFKENDRRALASESGVQVVELLEQDDGLHYSIVSKFPIPGPDGQTALVGGMAIDITDRMRAENALKEADRRKDEFLATLAHELRNPLAPIRNSLHILRMAGTTGPAAERMYEMMQRQVAHMVRLVDDLLEVSRISRGKIELKKERVELATIIDHAVETSKPFIEAANHQLSVSLPSDRIVVEGDVVRLAQVFSNLLNNAAKYTNPGGKISVAAKREGEQLIVSVRDTGIGIPRDMLSRVFEMFAQVENVLRRTQDGLGIGLNLVRTLVSMHGGSVEARSEGLGHGSEFIVRLPVAEPDSSASESAQPRAGDKPKAVPARHRILAVDDNKDSVDSLGMLLKFLGADVQVAYDGPSALEAVRICRPSIVLLDIGMPGMDGNEVARRIRQDPECRDVLLIALTGWGQQDDRRRTREAGFDHHLVKPVDLGALQALLSSVDERGT